MKIPGDGYAFLDFVRNVFAGIGIVFANIVNKLFDLIGMAADIDFINKFGNGLLDRIYIFVGIFVLFKAAIIVIRYVINPDELLDKKKGAQKFIINILISLGLITAGPTIFDQMFNVQAIILNENVLGKIVFGTKGEEHSVSDFGKKSTYYIFSSFIRYNVDSDLRPIFENCPNIFRDLDTNYSSATFDNYCGTGSYEYYRCATYLTKGANMSMDFVNKDYLDNSYYEKNYFTYDSRSNIVVDSAVKYNSELSLENNEKKIKNVNYYSAFKIGPSNSLDGYKHVVQKAFVGDVSIGFNTCNEHMINAGYCGVQNGIYIYWQIQRARLTSDVSLLYSSPIITAKDKNHLLYQMRVARGEVSYDDGHVNVDDPNGGACVCDASGATRDADACNKSAGGYIFDFDMLLPIVFGIVYMIVLFFLCIDIGLRAVKLAFFRIMSPIPFVSYMDITESKLFSQWLKMFLNTYLELFIKLGCVYLAAFLCDILLDDGFALSALDNNDFAKIIFLIGCFYFAKELPNFISKFFNLGGDQGALAFLKRSSKYLVGLGKGALIGGATFAGGAALGSMANSVNSVKDVVNGNFRNVMNSSLSRRDKADYLLQKVAAPISGAFSGGFRSLGGYINNGGGKFSFSNIREGVKKNNKARADNESLKRNKRTLYRASSAVAGDALGFVDKYVYNLESERLKQRAIAKDIDNINDHQKLSDDYKNRVTAYDEAEKTLNEHLYTSDKTDAIEKAFASNGESNPRSFEDSLQYKSFEEFDRANSGLLDIGTYNEFRKYYEDLYYAKFAKEYNEKRQGYGR